MKRFFKILIISFVVGFIGSAIYNIYIHKTEMSHIEKMILQNNTVKESIENSKYPTINEPTSSQVTVFAGDSVRTIRK
jgi:transcription antitermination factor NusG